MLRHKLRATLQQLVRCRFVQQSKTTPAALVMSLRLCCAAMCMSRCCLPGEGEEIEWNIGCLDILGLAGCMHAKWAEVTSARRRAHGFPTGYHSGHHSGDWSSRRGLVCQMLLPLPPPLHTSASTCHRVYLAHTSCPFDRLRGGCCMGGRASYI